VTPLVLCKAEVLKVAGTGDIACTARALDGTDFIIRTQAYYVPWVSSQHLSPQSFL
jgi:hypothetical protein